MSLHGNFGRAENGFEFPKDEFGEGKFHLKSSGGQVYVQDHNEQMVSAQLDGSIEQLSLELVEKLDSVDEGDKFLEVVGGSDYLKDFLEKLISEEPRAN